MVICLDTHHSLQDLLSNMSLYKTPACKTTLSRGNYCHSDPVSNVSVIPRRNRDYRSEERGRVMLESLEVREEKKKELSSPVCPPRSLEKEFSEDEKKSKRSSSSRGLTPVLKIHTWSYRSVPVTAEQIDFVEQLPLELSVMLLQRYIPPQDLLSCRIVNKYWHQICDLRSVRAIWRGYISDRRNERIRVGKENFTLSPISFISPHNRRMSFSRGPMSPIQLAQDSPTLLWKVFHTPIKTSASKPTPKHPSKPRVPSITEDTSPTPEKQSESGKRQNISQKSTKPERNPLQTLAFGTPNSQTSSLSRTSSRTSLSSLNSSKYTTPDPAHFSVTRSHTRSHTRSKRSPTSADISPPLTLNFNTRDGFKVPRTPTSPAPGYATGPKPRPSSRPISVTRPISAQKSRQRLRRL